MRPRRERFITVRYYAILLHRSITKSGVWGWGGVMASGLTGALYQWLHHQPFKEAAIFALYVSGAFLLITMVFEAPRMYFEIRQDRDHDAIKERLGEFISQGSRLQRDLSEHNRTSTVIEFVAWEESIEKFLIDNLGDRYLARFHSTTGLRFIPQSGEAHLYGSFDNYLSRLNEFLAELERK